MHSLGKNACASDSLCTFIIPESVINTEVFNKHACVCEQKHISLSDIPPHLHTGLAVARCEEYKKGSRHVYFIFTFMRDAWEH